MVALPRGLSEVLAALSRYSDADRLYRFETDAGMQAGATWMADGAGRYGHWLLLDGALLAPGAMDSAPGPGTARPASAYAGSPIAAFGDSAPRLLECRAGAESACIGWGRRLARGAPALSVLRVVPSTSLAGLQAICAYLAQVQVESRKSKVHCRFADTRVLPALLAVLGEAQLAPLAACVLEWGWFDRRGGWMTWAMPEGVHAGPAPPVLHLDIDQFRAMQAHAEADGIFHLLREQTPEVIPAQGRGEFHAELEQALRLASSYRVTEPKDRLQFVMLGLTCGRDFHLHPALQSTWKAISEGQSTLLESMRTWDDALWDALSKAGNA